jgi:hypothetical protein
VRQRSLRRRLRQGPIKATVSSSATITVDVLADSITFRLQSFS